MSCNPVFVVGSGRSGTTVLDKCLGINKNYCSIPFEPQLFSSVDMTVGIYQLLLDGGLSDEKKSVLKGYLGRKHKIENPRMKDIGYFHWFSRHEYLGILDDLVFGNSDVTERVRFFFERVHAPLLIEHSANDWIDGTPVNGRIIPQILKVFPDAKFLHIIRDGVSVANSFARLGWGGGKFETAAQFWANQVIITRSLGREFGGDNYREVIFDDLIANPEYEMKSICEFLAVDYQSSMIGLLEVDRAKKYKEEVSDYQRRYVNALFRI